MIKLVYKIKIVLYACKEKIEVGSGVDQGKLDFFQKGNIEEDF